MAVEVFQHRDEDYACWRAEHPDGYVLNVRHDTPPALHRARCTILRASGRARRGSPTKAPKVCSLDRGELEAWARANGRRIDPCPRCKV